jgi:hypothetical protein
MKKFLKVLGIIIIALIAGLFLLKLYLNEKEPQGITSPETDEMIQLVYKNLNKPAWDSTQWVKWTFNKNHYTWDKFQNKVKVIRDNMEVLVDLSTQKGIVKKDGLVIEGKEADKAVSKAYFSFCNDSYWLVAPFKLTDAGTTPTLVTLSDGRKGLKISYNSGGVTPGDSYVWILNDQGVPTSFKMWVSILPIGGIEGTWEDWQELSTGAKLATKHVIGGKYNSLATDVSGGMGAAF